VTYAVASALQQAVFQALLGHAPLAALVGAHVYDALPPGLLPPLYVALGPESARDRSDATGRGAEHELTVSVVADGSGFAQAKAAAAAVADALGGPLPTLARGRLVSLRFLRARAVRTENGESRQIDLVFRARVEDAGLPTP
jgi:hypothetical protein